MRNSPMPQLSKVIESRKNWKEKAIQKEGGRVTNTKYPLLNF